MTPTPLETLNPLDFGFAAPSPAPSGLDRGLLNPRPPQNIIERELPAHRLVLMLKLQGFTNREIAEKVGYTPTWVSQVVRQPWFREAFVEEVSKQGRQSLDELLRLEAAESLDTLITLRDDKNVSPAVRSSIAQNLLDRHLGKPIQRTESKVQLVDKVTEAEELDRKIREIEAELSGHTVTVETTSGLPDAGATPPPLSVTP